MKKIRVEMAQQARKSRVWLDDVEITSNVRGFVVKGDVGSISEVELTLSAPSIEIEGEAARVIVGCLPKGEGPGILQDGSTPERMRG